MNELFLRRPTLAITLSLGIMAAGLFSLPFMGVSLYPKVNPPTVSISASYTGADALAVEASVTSPIERSLSGIQGLQYVSSQSANDGSTGIDCTFALGTNLDQAANDVRTAVDSVQPRLPSSVLLQGISVTKNSGSPMMFVSLSAIDSSVDSRTITAFADDVLVPQLSQINGVADVQVVGEHEYAMRVWLNPLKLARSNLTVDDVVHAITVQNADVSAGLIGAPPFGKEKVDREFGVQVHGRLTGVNEFRKIALKQEPDGGVVHLDDVARVELGSETYGDDVLSDGRPGVEVVVFQRTSGSVLDISRDVRSSLESIFKKSRMQSIQYKIVSDRAEFLTEAIADITASLLIAILVVLIVVFAFASDWRSALIASVALPVSLLGAIACVALLGYSINALTLFGLTLSSGLVVDDAIVILENIRRIRARGASMREAIAASMKEITGAVVATSLVVLAVFLPVALIAGTTGVLFRQMAVTVSCAVGVSLLNALTLVPALSFRFGLNERRKSRQIFGASKVLEHAQVAYLRALEKAFRFRLLILSGFLIALPLTVWAYATLPTTYFPQEDQGTILIGIQTPEGFSRDRTVRVEREVQKLLADQPEVMSSVDEGGYGFGGSASNEALFTVRLKPRSQRIGAAHSAFAVVKRLNDLFAQMPQGSATASNVGSIAGLGRRSGFTFEVEDRENRGLKALENATNSLIDEANEKRSGVKDVSTDFTSDKPTLELSIDRDKAIRLGVDVNQITDAIGIFFGSEYVNDFDYQGREFKVFLQSDSQFRSRPDDLLDTYIAANPANTATSQSTLIPLRSFASLKMSKAPEVVSHFNNARSIEVNGEAANGFSTSQAMDKIEELGKSLPAGFSIEWSGISREERQSGTQSILALLLGAVIVYFVLAVQYESFLDPLVVMLSAPMAILGAIIGLHVEGVPANIFVEVGFVLLVGLAAKNAILIVEFAKKGIADGRSSFHAVLIAAEARFRPIVMTTIAFAVGVVPLIFASGALATARQSLGTVLLSGVIFSAILNLFITPLLFIALSRFRRVLGVHEPNNAKAPHEAADYHDLNDPTTLEALS